MECFPSMGEEGEMRDKYSIIGPLYDVLANCTVPAGSTGASSLCTTYQAR